MFMNECLILVFDMLVFYNKCHFWLKQTRVCLDIELRISFNISYFNSPLYHLIMFANNWRTSSFREVKQINDSVTEHVWELVLHSDTVVGKERL